LLLGLLAFGGLILGTSLTAFCVMHDANHGAYFRKRRFNHLMGWTADAAGLELRVAREGNVAHHTYTNVDGYDADITQIRSHGSPVQRRARGIGSSTTTSGRSTAS
jgi:linoleoyl-CoA desaturase